MEELFQKINNFSEVDLNLFQRIFEVKKEIAELKLPQIIEDKFKDAQKQEIIIIINKILNQETHFNIWRARRTEPQKENIKIENQYDPFCDVLNSTPEDEFGRLENESAITASNLTKSSKNHSLIIFKNHNFNENDIKNSLLLANNWFSNFEEKIKIIIWNYGFRSGASIFHPHLQIFSLEDIPEKIKYHLDKYKNYQEKFKSDYLNDIFYLSEKLNLAKKKNDFNLIVSLTPMKDNELFFWGKDFLTNYSELAKLIYSYFNLGIENFNFFLIQMPSFFLGFLVNRGESKKINSDIGALELYAFSVVGSNPFDLFNKLFRYW
ncbi:MAG: hypothetical protein NZ866_00005 [Patescibacteria group bacterium]|nr:hypothetical protein [Patescibacteria group bacterium]